MRVSLGLASLFLLVPACGGSFSTEAASTDAGITGAGTGGASGQTSSNGGNGTGGNPAGSAGGSSSGGLASDGGATSAGGVSSDGGMPGTGGGVAAGGVVGKGGASSTGGVVSTGGIVSTGGHVATGGVVGTGGIVGTGGAGTGGSPDCATTCAKQGLTCCAGSCVNTDNDPYHCGGCDKPCPMSEFFCSGGNCSPPVCLIATPSTDAGSPAPAPQPGACLSGQTCCGTTCCNQGEFCCEVTSNLASTFQCVAFSSGGTCPVGCPTCVCASPDTPIATPNGERAIASLAVGDLVYSVDAGRVVAVPLVLVHHQAARHHAVMHVALSNGSVLDVSAPHPTADGRLFGDLKGGDTLGGVTITSVTKIPYRFENTYDVLPASDTGTYFAGGVLIGSTLGGSALKSGHFDGNMLSMPE